jgi:hypothetical protein
MKKYFIILLIISSTIIWAHPKFYNLEEYSLNYSVKADSTHGFDVISYDISVTIDDENEFVNGSVAAVVEAEENLNQITYELEELNVSSVQVNGREAVFSHNNGELQIQLGSIAPGEQFTTLVNYSGNPQTSDDVYNIGMIFNQNFVFTLSDPSGCRWWWPAYDHPWDKAIINYSITVREDWLVACNGLRISIEDNGDGTRTHNWEGENPMATYLSCIHAAGYEELNQSYGDLPIQNFVMPSQYENASEDFSNLPFMIEVYSQAYGPYPFEKYGNAVVPMVTFGAMEHQTMTTLGNTMITGNHTYEMTIAHELSHHWFGDCLTPLTWADVWLSEGFAVYSEAVYMEAWQGYSQMLEYVQNDIQNYYKNWAASNGPHTVYDPEYNSYFTPATYEKPASVLHMLRRIVGNETFFTILQDYFQIYKNSNVISQEFIDICQQQSGLDLQQFFQQWIYGSGIPFFDYTYFVGENSLKTFVQTTSNTDTEFWVQAPFQIEYESGYDSLLVASSPQTAETTSAISTEATIDVLFDPNSWLLSRGNQYHGWEISDCYAADGEVLLTWDDSWIEIDGIDIYRSTSLQDDFEKINVEPVSDNFFLDSGLQNDEIYYYKIRAVRNAEYFSKFSEIKQASPMEFSLDSGILVIDESKDGNGAPGNPDDITVDEFYAESLGADFTSYDYAAEGKPELELLSQYSAILWHDDDLSEKNIEANVNELGCYLLAGGKLLLSGWKTANYFPATFIESFAQSSSTQLISEWEMIGTYSEDYPELSVDPDKLNPAFQGRLPYIVSFQTANYPVYYFAGIEGSSHQGEICAVKNENFILLGFPLYFFQDEGAADFLQQVKEEFGISHLEDLTIPAKTRLQAYPNPFNPTIKIALNIPENKKITLNIYNSKGQLVKSLFSGRLETGERNFVWNGKDDGGKNVGSGVYFLKYTTENEDITRKLILLK